jgi:hypothetical protein
VQSGNWKLSHRLCSLINMVVLRPGMRVSQFLVFNAVVLLASLCVVHGAVPASNSAILPAAFAGWQLAPPTHASADPAAADPVNATLLKEYGFTDFESATYSRDDGRKLTLKAARFDDATGAYGVFTYYRVPEMENQEIGTKGASLRQRVLFFRDNILIDANFDRLSAMSAAELRELADDLPRPQGSSANLPVLLKYLPAKYFINNTTKYIVGPIGLEKAAAPLAASFVDFSKGAEVLLGEYHTSDGGATLMLIDYPTPQIAKAQFEAIQSAQQRHQLGEAPIAVRRTGPIVVLISGQLGSDANALLSSVNYDADVTWNQNTYFTRRDNAANLIVGAILLTAILCGVAVLFSIGFGGFRILVQRLFPNRVFHRPEHLEIIAMNLSEPAKKPGDSGVTPTINAG